MKAAKTVATISAFLLGWLLLVFQLAIAQNAWQPFKPFNQHILLVDSGTPAPTATPTNTPTPTPTATPSGYAKWSAGTYTTALWDAQDVASGDWTDSVSSIVLAKSCNYVDQPTYEVAGSGQYAAWEGIALPDGTNGVCRFIKATGSAGLDVASDEHFVIQSVFKSGPVDSYRIPIGDGATTPYIAYFFFVYNGDATKGYFRVSDNTGNAAGGLYTRAASVTADTFYKFHAVCERGANCTVYENDTQVYQFSIAAVTDGFTNARWFASDTGWPANDYTFFTMKVDVGTNSAVLSVDDPGGAE